MREDVVHVAGSTEWIARLTGNDSPSRTASNFGLYGTDLGIPIEHAGRLYLLFGDTWARGASLSTFRECAGASIAWTEATERELSNGLTLTFETEAGNPEQYLDVRVDGVHSAEFEVPSGGFSDGTAMYAFFTEDSHVGPPATMGNSLLARSVDGRSWRRCYQQFSDQHFINVASVVIDAGQVAGVPRERQDAVLLWGTGTYRQSSPRLAWLPLDRVDKPRAPHFFCGLNAAGEPQWSKSEADAVALFRQPSLGELSVVRVLDKWLMTYFSEDCMSVSVRSAEQPWGPWSPPQKVFSNKDAFEAGLLHRKGAMDGLSDKGKFQLGGGLYAPYVLDRYTSSRADSMSAPTAWIYFVVSTWNPYNTGLMRTQLTMGRASRPSGNPTLVQGLPGEFRNFELMSPLDTGGVKHYWRNNHVEGPPYVWSAGICLDKASQVDAATFCQRRNGDLRVILRKGDALWALARTGTSWSEPHRLAIDGVDGAPCLIESTVGSGRLELLVPLASGGIGHFRKDLAGGASWHLATSFALGLGECSGVSLIQSSPRAFVATVTAGGDAYEYDYQPGDGGGRWGSKRKIGPGVRTPSLVKGAVAGNLELIVPRRDGGLNYFWRDQGSWTSRLSIYEGLGRVEAVSMIQWSHNDRLIAAARVGHRVYILRRKQKDGGGFAWLPPEETGC